MARKRNSVRRRPYQRISSHDLERIIRERDTYRRMLATRQPPRTVVRYRDRPRQRPGRFRFAKGVLVGSAGGGASAPIRYARNTVLKKLRKRKMRCVKWVRR